jgi:drug/metabolite transporter (DMT)-like permease
MLLWGSLGLFSRSIAISAFELAFFRAFIALPVLFILMWIRGKREKMRIGTMLPYVVSGMFIGLAWVALFLGYGYTSISTAVLVYNMCPVYVMLLSPMLLKEKLNRFQIVMVIGCFLGLYFLIGSNAGIGEEGGKGIFFAFLSGVIYAGIVIANRKLNLSAVYGKVDTLQATFIQLLGASVVLFPYQLVNHSFTTVAHLAGKQLAFLIVLGVVHTGVAYFLYFTSYKKLKAIEIVSFSYLEPLFSIFLSMLFLGERMIPLQIAGGVLILGLTFLNEFYSGHKKQATQ